MLTHVADGSVSVEEAVRRLKCAPFEEIGIASLDAHRADPAGRIRDYLRRGQNRGTDRQDRGDLAKRRTADDPHHACGCGEG